VAYVAEAPTPPPDGYHRLFRGDPAPWFQQATSGSPLFPIDLAAGRYVVLCFLLETGDAAGQRALDFVATNRQLFDDEKLSFFGVSINWRDQYEGRTKESLPGVRFFWDFDLTVARLYGAVPFNAGRGVANARRQWFVLDPTLRIVAVARFQKEGAEQRALRELLSNLPPVTHFAGIEAVPPILYLPNVFEPELCRSLIDVFDADGGQETGSLVQSGSETIAVQDHAHKRRSDYLIRDPQAITEIQKRIQRRIVPEMAKAFQFDASKTERYLVGCYREGGHFAAHRDNTTDATAHRRFAVSVNLNDDYEGGEIGFPEYGPRRYKPPTGGAVVFSCSLLHAVSAVTRGRRYAFLPFLHDEAAQWLLLQNHGG
jgi:predicted 2-oxoglutarate/Fe(II)-dependent dioxygenase YbiX/peroxiredoxin